MTTITSKNPSPYYGIATGADYQSPITMPLDFTAFGDKLSYSDYKGGNEFRPLALAAWLSPKEETPHENRRGDPDTTNTQYPISPSVPVSTDPKPEIPDPIWHLTKIGDLTYNLRSTCHESFACHYALKFAPHNDLNPTSPTRPNQSTHAKPI